MFTETYSCTCCFWWRKIVAVPIYSVADSAVIMQIEFEDAITPLWPRESVLIKFIVVRVFDVCSTKSGVFMRIV